MQAVKIEPCRRPKSKLNWKGAPSQPYESAAARYADAPIRRPGMLALHRPVGGARAFPAGSATSPPPVNLPEGGMTDGR